MLAVALPASAALTLLPFTVNGLGVREGALIALLAKGGVSIANATAMTVFVDIQLLPLALIGAAAWVFRPQHARTPWSALVPTQEDRSTVGT